MIETNWCWTMLQNIIIRMQLNTHRYIASAILDSLQATRWEHSEYTYVHASNTRIHTRIHILLLGRYSRVRDVRGPQGRAMLHRELHYVYAHSLHCAAFSRTLSFYLHSNPSFLLPFSSLLSLSLSLSLSPLFFSIIYVLFSHRTSFSLWFFAIIRLASYCISGAVLIFFAVSCPTSSIFAILGTLWISCVFNFLKG